ncbi:MAG: phosphatidylserine/phosphatidylglycerophosphate/cardiolipin synthase family protein [Opitutales bacterium]|nr:phosphatidylserine/phosphatidylglycerophosphate/cardiolipin synthase family protein [Opitutales bacterium]
MRRKKYRLPLITVVLTVIATLGASIFYFNARPVSKRVTVHIESVPPVSDPGFRRTLEALMGGPVVSGNRIDWLKDGKAIYEAKLDAIASATESVTFEVYEYWGDIAGRFAEAFAERAEAGVPVHVILDYVGSIGADSAFFEKMEDAGVELVRWREPSWYRSSRFNHRTHRKLLIVDGRVGFTGGANVADAWLGEEAGQYYRENHYRFEGPIVNQLQAAFMDNWLFATGKLLLGDRYFPALEDAGDLDLQVVISSPREGHKRIRTLLFLAFAAAQENIRIQTAFFYPDYMLEDALLKAAERGVSVDILAPGPDIAEPWVRFASRNRWGNLLRGHIRIHEYTKSPLHAKTFIIDDQWVSIGSANFHNRSFRLNDEANVNIFDPDFARKMIDMFDDDLDDATAYDLARWKERPWTEWLRGVIGNLIGPHL